ncbi:MAG: hypothetical protein ACI9FB_002070 [Candidatus Azotimanducaceae bacterium]|jgi:hypothetical protein
MSKVSFFHKNLFLVFIFTTLSPSIFAASCKGFDVHEAEFEFGYYDSVGSGYPHWLDIHFRDDNRDMWFTIHSGDYLYHAGGTSNLYIADGYSNTSFSSALKQACSKSKQDTAKNRCNKLRSSAVSCCRQLVRKIRAKDVNC